MKSSDIVNKRFSRAFMGYDTREVDAFLDALIEELERLQRDCESLRHALDTAGAHGLPRPQRQLSQFSSIGERTIPALPRARNTSLILRQAKHAETEHGSAQPNVRIRKIVKPERRMKSEDKRHE